MELWKIAVTQELTFSAVDKQMYCLTEGREAFRQLAKLCGDPNLVGIRLLDHISTLPLSELSCSKMFTAFTFILVQRAKVFMSKVTYSTVQINFFIAKQLETIAH